MKVPILKLKNILLTSIPEELTDRDAVRFQEDVLGKASEPGADGIVIDITALEVIDSFMARLLNDTAEMVQLLGLKAVICGMQPAVAYTLNEMGRRMIGVETVLDLDRGFEKIQEMMAADEG